MTTAQIDRMLSAYIECALWSSTDESDGDGHSFEHNNYSADDLSDDARTAMGDDVWRFAEGYGDLLDQAGVSPEQAGHDFWLTRNRHGAGFWDRGLGHLGDVLTDVAYRFGECDLYLSDAGEIEVA